jgi:hypothetical protein
MLLREKIEYVCMFLGHPFFQIIVLSILLLLHWIYEAFVTLIGLVQGAMLLPQEHLMPAKPFLY